MTNFFLILTTNCNLKCKYCYGEAYEFYNLEDDNSENIDYTIPEEINYSLEDLSKFLNKDKNSNIILYGGEPLMRIDIVENLLSFLKVNNILLHTNGTLLNLLDSKYLKKINTISISIDGDQ